MFTKLQSTILLLSLLFFIGCNKSDSNNNITLEKSDKDFEKNFTLIDSIIINKNDIEKYEMLGVNKIYDIGDGRFIIKDTFAHKIFLMNSDGNIQKLIAQKGNGPGEFLVIADFTFDNNGNLLVLDWQKKSVSIFDQNMDYVDSHRLSFSHGYTWRIYSKNNKFYIVAHKRLSANSTKKDYSILSYSEETLVNVYTEDFNYKDGFLKLAPELERTNAAFLRGRYGFAHLAFYDKKIFAISDEGFYKISVFNENGILEKEHRIKDKEFVEFDLNRIEGISFSDKTKPLPISQKEMGAIITHTSAPTNFEIIDDLLFVVIDGPSSNYFPNLREYSEEEEMKHIDVFQILGNNLKSLASGIDITKQFIGIDKECLFFTNGFDIDSDDELVVYKYKFR